MSPRTKEQLEKIRQASRKAIMDAALSLFGAHGYASTTIEAIARKAGVAKGLVYNYFRNKEHLLEEVVLEGLREFRELAEQIEGIRDPVERLASISKIYAEFVTERADFIRLYSSLLLQSPPERVRAILGHYLNEFHDRMRRSLEEAGIPDAAIEAYKLDALLDGIALNYIVLGEEYYPHVAIVESAIADLIKRSRAASTEED